MLHMQSQSDSKLDDPDQAYLAAYFARNQYDLKYTSATGSSFSAVPRDDSMLTAWAKEMPNTAKTTKIDALNLILF